MRFSPRHRMLDKNEPRTPKTEFAFQPKAATPTRLSVRDDDARKSHPQQKKVERDSTLIAFDLLANPCFKTLVSAPSGFKKEPSSHPCGGRSIIGSSGSQVTRENPSRVPQFHLSNHPCLSNTLMTSLPEYIPVSQVNLRKR